MPTTPQALAGHTIEPSVSVPIAIGARPAATAAPEPELDPDGLRSSACGLAAWPPSVLQPLVERVERKLAHSDRFALPRITAPASRSRRDQERVAPVRRAAQGGRARGGGQAADVDVVLDQDRDAVQRAAGGGAFLVAGGGLAQGVRADRGDRAEDRVELRDALQVIGGERHRRGGTRGRGARAVSRPLRPGARLRARTWWQDSRVQLTMGDLEVVPARDRPDLLAPAVASALAALAGPVFSGAAHAAGDAIGVAEIDPALADTAAFCERYGVDQAESANCVVISGRRGGETRFAACVVLATTRADVNGAARRELDVRKASFAAMDVAVAETGMEYGGITPVGLPAAWPILVNARVAAAAGGGDRQRPAALEAGAARRGGRAPPRRHGHPQPGPLTPPWRPVWRAG